ncbi:hypothetical protein Cagg_3290 [Chloroflexus aggregans DSM 9485]|uniref:Uncharacterized protein n=2 Tax=Chloroflexus aggregans TaxID=152260 RepID=B8G888_CHLAD|nr:hypothetical protein Cagg_3290 [Chloroflexus aggregans DSM 9485]
MDELETSAQIDVLEVMDMTAGTAVMEAELAYWEQPGKYHNHLVETVTVQEHHAWWIHTTKPLKAMELAGTLWVDSSERVYRFRLHCRPDKCAESERQLRQMLSTLQVTDVDWQRAPGPPPVSPNNDRPGQAGIVPSSPQVVSYDRNAAYAYAATWWNTQNNSDGCYLRHNGSTLDCTYHSSDYGVDGAHFVNRAVAAGGRPF